MTSYEIASAWAEAIAADTTLTAWAVTTCGRTWDVRVGWQPDHLPAEDEAPLVVLDPERWSETAARDATTHTINVAVAVSDEAWETVNGVRNLRGLRRLDREVLPRLLAVVDMAVPGVRRGATRIDYDPQFFPLLYLDAAITVEIGRPVGSRR